MSGAGKSMAAKQLEDLGFFCVDNLPPSLIPKFVEICMHSSGKMNNIALVTDIRGGVLLNELVPSLDELNTMGVASKIVFLEASDEALVNRFKESRRTHPLTQHGRIQSGITEERKILSPIKSIATYIVDTTKFSSRRLKDEIVQLVSEDIDFSGLAINIMSFGFKYGVPLDCDMIFDVRFVPNPFYIPELKKLTGKNPLVANYVYDFEETGVFMDKLLSMLEYLIPFYEREGKSQLVVALGCTGGKHRSVAMAEDLTRKLEELGMRVFVEHRDIDRSIN
jgi:UPF0042 nucleotide-binding protein